MKLYDKAIEISKKLISTFGLEDWEIGLFEDDTLEHTAEVEVDFPEKIAHIFYNPKHEQFNKKDLRKLLKHEFLHICLSPIRSLLVELFPSVASDQCDSLLASFYYSEELAVGILERIKRI